MIPLDPWWIVGLVDGEGCFSIDVINNSTLTLGVQVQANLSVTQSVRSLSVLERIQAHFGCGQIQLNPRHDDHRDHLAIYRVRKLSDLQQIILPFFNRYPLQTIKAHDFALFAEVVERMGRKEHLSAEGLQAIQHLKLRLRGLRPLVDEGNMESSETIRRAPASRR